MHFEHFEALCDRLSRRSERKRIQAVDDCVQDGERLLRMCALAATRAEWLDLLRSLGLSPRTAVNKMAVFCFAKAAPDLFERARHRPLAELYRLSYLTREELEARLGKPS